MMSDHQPIRPPATPRRRAGDRPPQDEAKSTQQWEAAIVFRGPPPPPGVLSHQGDPLFLRGDRSGLTGALEGQLHPLDQVMVLEPARGKTAETIWLMVRPRIDVLKASVLVVEDNEVNSDYYSEVLVGLGLTVFQAESGAEAVSMMTSNDIDLALIDVRLPDANGFELCRVLASESGVDHCPMILMSADPAVADPARVQAAGAVGFIVNPVGPQELAAEVTRILSEPESRVGIDNKVIPQAVTVVPQLRFFGRPSIDSGSEWVDLPPGLSTDLLATLAAACPMAVSPDRLAQFVWPAGAKISSNAVYTAVSRLRHFLTEIGLDDTVVTDGLGYRLDIDPEMVDLVQFERDGVRLLGEADAPLEELENALSLWGGQPFPGTKNELLARWASRLVETRSRLVEALAMGRVKDGDPAVAVGMCQDLLADEPWRESLWSLLVVALYRVGRTNDALEAHRRARDQLREELGLDPGPALASLDVMVLSHDPQLLDNKWLSHAFAGLYRSRSRV